MVEIEHFVVEGLQRALGKRDQPHRDVERGQPRRRLHQMREMLEVDLDVAALADAAHGWNQPHRSIRFDHSTLLC
jgi:hypothetical protein